MVNLIYERNQVMNFVDHATKNGRIFFLHHAIHFLEPERVKRSFLIDRSTYPALCLFNLYSCHNGLSSEYFFHRNTTMLSNSTGITHLTQSQDRRLNQVVGIGRSLGLSQNVLDTSTLEYSTHGTTGHNSRTFGSGKNQYISSAKLSSLLVRNRSLDDRNLYQILLGSLYTLGNCSRNFACFTKTAADYPFTVSDNNDGGKGKGATTFGYLNYAIDSNQSIL